MFGRIGSNISTWRRLQRRGTLMNTSWSCCGDRDGHSRLSRGHENSQFSTRTVVCSRLFIGPNFCLSTARDASAPRDEFIVWRSSEKILYLIQHFLKVLSRCFSFPFVYPNINSIGLRRHCRALISQLARMHSCLPCHRFIWISEVMQYTHVSVFVVGGYPDVSRFH